MAIRDIPVTTVQSENNDWTTFLQVGKGGLTADPQSGGILKVLADNGFAEKIKNGVVTGHTYNVWHTPPSIEFVLVDSWTDQEGATKKHYEFFKISSEAVTIPKITPALEESAAIIPETQVSNLADTFAESIAVPTETNPEPVVESDTQPFANISVSVANNSESLVESPDSLALIRQVSADVDAFLAKFNHV